MKWYKQALKEMNEDQEEMDEAQSTKAKQLS